MKTPKRSRSQRTRKRHMPPRRSVKMTGAGAHQGARERHTAIPDSLFDEAPVPMVVATLDKATIVRVNRSGVNVLGRSADDVSSRTLAEAGWVSSADQQRMFDALRRDGSFERIRTAVEVGDGRMLETAWSGVVIHRRGGSEALLVAMDDGDRRKEIDAMRRNEDRYRRLVEISPESIVLHVNGILQYVNEATLKLFGASSKKEMEGRPVLDFVDPSSRDLVRKRMSIMWDDRETVPLAEEKFLRLDGTSVDVEVAAAPLVYEGRRAVLVVARDITERKRVRESLEKALHEKEVLLKEIHHRVKNNMQVIASLLNLQANEATDSQTREGLIDTQNRVRSMALVHEKLYRSGTLARIDFGEYIKNITEELARTYKKGNIREEVVADPVYVEVDTAIPCGLIINEIVSNAFKHAFPGDREGRVQVDLHEVGDGDVELRIKDDGVGIPAAQDPSTMGSMGMKIIYALADQISARVTVERNEGTTFVVRFKPGGTLHEGASAGSPAS